MLGHRWSYGRTDGRSIHVRRPFYFVKKAYQPVTHFTEYFRLYGAQHMHVVTGRDSTPADRSLCTTRTPINKPRATVIIANCASLQQPAISRPPAGTAHVAHQCTHCLHSTAVTATTTTFQNTASYSHRAFTFSPQSAQ